MVFQNLEDNNESAPFLQIFAKNFSIANLSFVSFNFPNDICYVNAGNVTVSEATLYQFTNITVESSDIGNFLNLESAGVLQLTNVQVSNSRIASLVRGNLNTISYIQLSTNNISLQSVTVYSTMMDLGTPGKILV